MAGSGARLWKRKAAVLGLGVVLTVGSVIPAGITGRASAASSDLFFSEYVEGSSFNKALEIYNGTGQAVDLSGYTLVQYNNGASPSAGTVYAVKLQGQLADGDVYVVANSQSNAAILSKADLTGASNFFGFNGDDTLVLYRNYNESTRQGTVVDVIGKIGEDPGTAWSIGGVSTVDQTLVRKSSVTAGDTNGADAFDPSIEWVSKGKDVFSYLGHALDGMDSGNGGGDETPVLLPIAEARARAVGATVTIEGVVTADNAAIGGSSLSTFVQDVSGGINVYGSSTSASLFPELTEGMLVQVEGKLAAYKGLTEIMPTKITVKAEGQTLPTPIPMTLLEASTAATAEPNEGEVVQVRGYVTDVPATAAGEGYNVPIIDEQFNGMTLRVMEGTNAISGLKAGTWYDFTGILSQYDSYQLLPRKTGDLVEVNPQPPAPAPAASYSSTVSSVVDGDTIHLATPVLGVTKVRMLSIDTPEKSYEGQSQGYYAEAAAAKLAELLPVGTPIQLEVGQDPIDGYGRLLAHVHIQESGLDVNKEMVRTGNAVNYFIWPNMDHFEEYSAAAEEAITNGYGIHNPLNPIPQLPYQFRFELRGGPDKYVGDYYSKTYVSPDRWKEIPTENRVFFFTEEEAKAAGYAPAAAGQPYVSVQLLSVNDLHGKIDVTAPIDGKNYGRADYMAAYLKQREAMNPNTLIVHAGDMVGGSSPVSALLQDEPTVEIMEAIGFDVGTVGNHEFDEGVEEMLRMVHGGTHPNGTAGYDGISFPMIAANIEYKENGQLVLPPYTIQEVGGVKIGFIGVATTETPEIIIPAGNEHIRFTDEAAAINQYVPELQAQGVKAIVVLAHNSGTQSGDTVTGDIASIANAVNDEVDVIFSAHNHQKNNGLVDGKLIVQAWEYGKAIGDVDLLIDPATGDIVSKKAEIVDVVQNGMSPDPTVEAILKKYGDMVASKLNEVIGVTTSEMTKAYPTKEVYGDDDLGNFLADAMRWSVDSDFALMNGGGVRDNLDAGEITWGELFNVQPFGNTVVRVDVTGAELEEILNAMINPRYGPDSFISGAFYTWDTATGKVKQIHLPTGEPVQKDAVYSLAVNNYMYEQTSDKYKLIKEYGEYLVQGPVDVDATVGYLRSVGEPISYQAEARISTDILAPVTSVVSDGVTGEHVFNNEDVTLKFGAQDEAGTGVLRTEVSMNGGEWKSVQGSYTVQSEGVNLIQYRSIDKVFNVENTKKIVIAIDKTAPVIEIHAPEAIYSYEAFPFELRVSDAISGVQSVHVTLDGEDAETAFTLDPLTLEAGIHRIVVEAADQAGNTAAQEFTFEVLMDVGHLDELVQWGIADGELEAQEGKALLNKIGFIQGTSDRNTQSNQLEALVHYLNAQSGKKVPVDFADELIETIQGLLIIQ